MEKTFLYIGFQIVLYLMWMICFSILFPSRFRLRLSLPLMVLAFLTFAFVTEALPEQSMTRAFLGALLSSASPSCSLGESGTKSSSSRWPCCW